MIRYAAEINTVSVLAKLYVDDMEAAAGATLGDAYNRANLKPALELLTLLYEDVGPSLPSHSMQAVNHGSLLSYLMNDVDTERLGTRLAVARVLTAIELGRAKAQRRRAQAEAEALPTAPDGSQASSPVAAAGVAEHKQAPPGASGAGPGAGAGSDALTVASEWPDDSAVPQSVVTTAMRFLVTGCLQNVWGQGYLRALVTVSAARCSSLAVQLCSPHVTHAHRHHHTAPREAIEVPDGADPGRAEHAGRSLVGDTTAASVHTVRGPPVGRPAVPCTSSRPMCVCVCPWRQWLRGAQ